MELHHGTWHAANEAAVPDTPADVDVGVIYTQERLLISRLLGSLRQSGDGLAMRLILVDNAAEDGVEQWREIFPPTTVLHNRRRLGYAANLNRILQASRSPYILLLNTDMYFDPHEQCLAKMVDFMNSRPDCGIAGCRLYHADGRPAPSARRFQTAAVILARRFGLGKLLRRTLDDYFYREHAAHQSWECDWLSGCFLMIRRAALQQVGFFDTGFVKYFEDVDMCLRMAQAGWRVMYHGGTYCYHLEQRASKSLFSADARKHVQSYLRWLLKWGLTPSRGAPAGPLPQRRAA